MPEDEEECKPCALGVPIEIARELCKATGDAVICEQRFTELTDDKITVQKYLDEVKKLNIKNPVIHESVTNCEKVLKDQWGNLDRFVDQIVEEEGILDE